MKASASGDFPHLVEADGHKILFDTGARPRTVLENAKELKIDLSDVQDVVLSHFHDDHTTGLMTLRREFAKTNPAAFSRVHVGKGIFLERARQRSQSDDRDEERLRSHRRKIYRTRQARGDFSRRLADRPDPARYPEKNYPAGIEVQKDGAWVEDNLPEDHVAWCSTLTRVWCCWRVAATPA